MDRSLLNWLQQDQIRSIIGDAQIAIMSIKLRPKPGLMEQGVLSAVQNELLLVGMICKLFTPNC